MNAINTDLTNRVVVFKEQVFQPEYRALRYRIWSVLSGYGANPMLQGRIVRCRSLATGSESELDAMYIERLATQDDLAVVQRGIFL